MTDQDHPLTGDGQSAGALRADHHVHVLQSLTERLGPPERLTPLQKRLNCGGITTGMLQDSHRPALLDKGPGQPVKLLRISSQARH